MKYTKNYNLNLYEPNDLANLSDGYNNSMEKMDTAMKSVEDFVQTYDAAIEQNAADIVTEKNRATAAEDGLKQVDDNLQSSINAEYTRALNAESGLQEAIAAETKRAQTSENELATGVSNAVQAVATEKNRAEAAEKTNADAISTINNGLKNVIAIGDSFTAGTLSDWISYIHGYNITNYAVNGSSLHNPGSGGANFFQQLEKAHETFPDSNQVHMVILYGGVNDHGDGYAGEETGKQLATWIKNATTYFPNSKIVVCYGNAGRTFLTKYSDYPEWLTSVRISALVNATYKNVSMINPENWLKYFCGTEDQGAKGYFAADNLHPNTYGDYVIASYMQAIMDGTYAFRNMYRSWEYADCPIVGYVDNSEIVYGHLKTLRLICQYTDSLTPKVYGYARSFEVEDTITNGSFYFLQPSTIKDASEYINWGVTGNADNQRWFPLTCRGRLTNGTFWKGSPGNSGMPDNRMQLYFQYNTAVAKSTDPISFIL